MNNNSYLIPANSKKSQLILSMFTPTDLVIFGIGLAVTIALALAVKTSSVGGIIGILAPALFATFLVAPIPNYHNIMTLISSIINYAFNRKTYFWRGWCAGYGDNTEPSSNATTNTTTRR